MEILKQKDWWFHKWKQHRNNEYCLKQFKFYRNKPVSMMRKRKKEYFTKLVQEAEGNTKRVWEIAKDAVGLDLQ